MELFASYGVTPYFSQRDSSSDITLMSQSSLMNQPGPLWPTQKNKIPKIQKKKKIVTDKQISLNNFIFFYHKTDISKKIIFFIIKCKSLKKFIFFLDFYILIH